MTDSASLAEVGPWAEEKLEVLERYLDAYTKVMKNQPHWRTLYVDAFAGGGRAKLRQRRRDPDLQVDFFAAEATPEQTVFVAGSPERALRIANPFDRYVFIDADPDRIAALEALRDHYGSSRTISIREGYADDQIAWVLSQKIARQTHRGVAFLDPFGAHIAWKSVAALAASGVFEIILNFPFHMALNRLMTKDPNIPQNWREQLDAFFPRGWFEEAYESPQDMFADGTISKRPDAERRLLEFYRRHLKEAFGFVSTPRLIRNTRGGPLYYLLWAGPNRKGLEIADYVMRMGEKLPR